MFDKSFCASCEGIDCLMNCQWIDFNGIDDARLEMQKLINEDANGRVLQECIACFGCDEYCPNNSHPFDLINELQEKHNPWNMNPAMVSKMIDMYEPKRTLEIREIDPTKPVLNKCAFPKVNGKQMKGKMFDNLQSVGGLHYFCNLVYQHVAKPSVIKERVPIVLDNFKKIGVQKNTEVICWHDECYGLYTSYCERNDLEVPFKPVHLYEYVYNYLKQHESEIKKLNLKIAYQRGCSNRYIPETDKWLDKVCELIGVERVARQYDKEQALCCGGAFPWKGKKELLIPTQTKNIEDMIQYSAEACVFNCPACKETLEKQLTEKGIKSYFISDLARLALGESLDY
ncbi:MAG: (Fe-S)-binding protein [Candidatus Lokiarchaeota archaeon]|nr:(Fe-S)-binding protein [Candidatus Lokiarchaeota archaeon]